MARIKISKYNLLPIFISIILFIIPFFWFGQNEIDLGGDSSRLYFYNPMWYLFSSALYVISPSSFGSENLNYTNLPFILLIIFLKSIITSPTILAATFYGFSLSAAFIFCYLTIKELIDREKGWYAAIVGALVYVLSPALIDGWAHVLITYNQIFLNPLIFYLLLRYFKTAKIQILFVVIFLTFIFAPNFGIGAAPALFAFYPLSIVFLILYTKLIMKRKIIIKHMLLGLALFIGIQAFNIVPQIISMFSPGSEINSTIFSSEGKFDRGLSYFTAIVPNIKATINLMGLPQMKDLTFFSKVFLVLPLIITIAFFFNKQNSSASQNEKKTMLLTSFFYLLMLFFATANITNIWLTFYETLFNIPGFSMFRNFYGQWQYAYIFFYSIFLGQALYIIITKLKQIYAYVLTFSLILILIINALPLIKGHFTRGILWQSNNIEAMIQMDPDYEEVLSFVRSLPTDGRVLTLPLSDPGYQIIAGKNGGAYMGPSTIAYLGGKKDFAGFDELGDYRNLILELARDNEFEILKRILGILNVKYIFYNADPIIYDEFPEFPYQHVRDFLPQDQNSYKEFVEKLNVREIKNIKNKFFVFELQNTYYLPHISIAKKSIHFNKLLTEIQTPLSLHKEDNRLAIHNYGHIPADPKVKFEEYLIDTQENSSLLDFFVSAGKLKFGFPFASWKLTSVVYPYIVFRENQELASYRELDQTHIDRRIFLAHKRIAELEKWGKETSVLGNVKSIDNLNKSWQEPNIWEAVIFRKYNFWEIGLLRYQRAIAELIEKIEEESLSEPSFNVNKDRIRRAISTHKEIFYRIIEYDEKLSRDQKIYLLTLVINMFDSITNRLRFEMPTLEEVTYNLDGLQKGEYDIFIDKKSIQYFDQSKLRVVINDKELPFNDLGQVDDWFKVENALAKKDKNSLKLLIPGPVNLISETKWEPVEDGNLATNSASLTINDTVTEKVGLVREIAKWNRNSYYIVSFEYVTHGKGFRLLLFDKARGERHEISKVLEDELRSPEWKTYKSIVASSDDAISAFIQVLKPTNNNLLNQMEPQEQITKIDIRNLSVIQVPNPKIIFRKANITDPDKNIPSITFTRINPTKYEVKVRNAIVPYTLVLIDEFNEKWRLIDPTQNTNTIRSFFSRIVAKMGMGVLGIFDKENASNRNTVIAYFNGDVNENASRDIFLNKKTFETWGKTEIAEYTHFPVNGYANAWYIEPSDTGHKTDYDLIIEMTDQKLFYGVLFISILTAFITLLLLVRFLKQ